MSLLNSTLILVALQRLFSSAKVLRVPYSEQRGDQLRLPLSIASRRSFDLPFPYHVHGFNAFQAFALLYGKSRSIVTLALSSL
jgi:hypothetical protein